MCVIFVVRCSEPEEEGLKASNDPQNITHKTTGLSNRKRTMNMYQFNVVYSWYRFISDSLK